MLQDSLIGINEWEKVCTLLAILTYMCYDARFRECKKKMEFYIWGVFENSSIKFKFEYNPLKTSGTLHEDLHKFVILLVQLHVSAHTGHLQVVFKRT